MVDSNHASREAVAAVTITLTCMAITVTALRLHARFFVVRNAGLDDAFILAAVVCSIAVTVMMGGQIRYGMGRHWSTLSDNDKIMVNLFFWASVWIYYTGLGMVKLSILLQYLRVITIRKFRLWTYGLMFVVASYSVATIFSAAFVCTPVTRFWNREIEGSCIDENAVWFANTALNIITDTATTILPLPVLRTLRLPTRQKMLLTLVFGLGFTTCIVSMLRLHSLVVIAHSDDLTWDNPMPAVWSSTELNVAILCSCLPTLKGLISRVWPKLLGSGQRSTPESRTVNEIIPVQDRRAAERDWEHELDRPRLNQYGHSNKFYLHDKPKVELLEDKSGRHRRDTIRVRTNIAVQDDGRPTLDMAGPEDVGFLLRRPTDGV